MTAEEVAEVYPDLVVRGAGGQVETVQYQKLTPMLLNEVQKQNTAISAKNSAISARSEQILSLEERLAQMEAALQRYSISSR